MNEMSDTILRADRFQSTAAEAFVCGNDPSHGRLWAHKSGSALMCTARDCDYVISMDHETIESWREPRTADIATA